jgi:hypothetical protein
LSLALLFPSCSLLRAVLFKRCGPFAGVTHTVWFCNWHSPVIVIGTSLGVWTIVLVSVWWAALVPSPVRLSTMASFCLGMEAFNRIVDVMYSFRRYLF